MSLSILARLGLDSSEFKSGLRNATNESKSFGEKLSASITTAAKLAGAALAGLAIKGTADMVQFQKGVSEVFTLMPGISKKAMGAMEKDVRELARSMGLDLNDAVSSLYQAISAGVDPNNAIDFLRTSAKTAIGGVASLEDSVGALTTVINGYGMSAKEATKVSDVLFSVVKNGVTNMTELGQNIGKVTPIAASLGVTIEEVGAMFAVLTKQMGAGKTAEAGTAIRSMLAELAKEGMKANENFKALGKGGFKEFIANGGQVGEALMMMKERAEASGKSLMDMFRGVEAGNGALMLVTQGGKALSAQLQNIHKDAGATETAFATMEQTVSRQIDKLLSNFKEMGLQIGEAFLPVLIDLLPRLSKAFIQIGPAIAEIGKAFADVMLFIGSFGKEIAASVGFMIKFALVAKGMMIVVTLAKGMRALVVSLQAARAAQIGLNTAMAANPIGLVVGAVALLVTGIMELINANDELAEEQKKRAKEYEEGLNKQIKEFAEGAKDATAESKRLVKTLAELKGVEGPGEMELPLEETRDLLLVNEKLLSKMKLQRDFAADSVKSYGEQLEQMRQQNTTLSASGQLVFDTLENEKSYNVLLKLRADAMQKALQANVDMFEQRKKILDLQERENLLAEAQFKTEEDIAKVIKTAGQDLALSKTEAGKIVILGREIKDLEMEKKDLIDQARQARILEVGQAERLRDVEQDIINKRQAVVDIVKNKLKQARTDELQAVRDIVSELDKALNKERDRANQAKAAAQAKEDEVKALRDNLKDAQANLDDFKRFFNKDIRGKLKVDVGELRTEFKKLKEQDMLPEGVRTLKDFEMLTRKNAGEAKRKRDQVIADGKDALAEAKRLRQEEKDANDEAKRIEEEIAEKKKEAIKLENELEEKKLKTLEQYREERKELERVLADLQKVNLLPEFDATIVETLKTQSDNLKKLDNNVAALAGKSGSIAVGVDLDDSDINKESTQVAILETLEGYFINQ
jgi:TP901 family phage tail tape measure protein